MFRKSIAQKIYLCVLVVVLGFTASCKKNNSQPGPEESTPAAPETNNLQTPTTDRNLLTKDSIFLYAKQTYFWNVGMPSYDDFNPRRYASNESVVAAIRALKSNGGKDKYSFIDDGSVAGQLSGVSGDYGFSANFDSNDILRIRYVYLGSPADKQGVKRGYRITKVNGSPNVARVNSNIDFLNNAIFGSNPSVSLTLVPPSGGTAFDVTITRETYAINPILFSKTYTAGSKKVGYIVFNSFTTNALPRLDEAFKTFAADGITELVVDLRYNGGGSVATADAFTNLIAPPSQNGKVMYTTYWTQTMQDGKATILENQKFYYQGILYSMFDNSYKPTQAAGNQEVFKKRGTLNNLTRVYFLVTNYTASASELLINNLKPVMDVKLIGSTTYGKPVGFFSIRIDKNDLYIPQFQTKNSVNFGEYFSGMTVDREITDNIAVDFGDPAENLLSQALHYSTFGNFSYVQSNNKISSTSGISSGKSAGLELTDHEFKGMVETRIPGAKR
ncbi:S41 family peptidase [Pedobacter punctiformis]|uniref:S41 family peptidase n=1 Tax=Pedobacter punctiformis TaxID=3004097 RepID=A0ABT4L8T0_9SPHI|nr:S41 family peptidase [Pedobacter sp. HCMS5-2]MCZ4244324.1 S41 family peptidase [Pedobacter sp. HCMS5-2]